MRDYKVLGGIIFFGGTAPLSRLRKESADNRIADIPPTLESQLIVEIEIFQLSSSQPSSGPQNRGKPATGRKEQYFI